MSEKQDSLTKQEQAVEVKPGNLMAALAAAASNPAVDADKMERLFAMHMQMVKENQRVAYVAAMTRIAPRLVPVTKSGYNEHQKKPYVMLEDLDAQLRPILAEEGLAMSFDSAPVEGKPNHMRFFGMNSHRDGHVETRQIDLEVDKSGSKNGTQAGVSTAAYARRALVTLFYNTVGKGEDADGEDLKTITTDQVKDLEIMIADTKSSKAKFLELIAGVESLEAIPARDYRRVMNALETKARQTK